MAWVLWHQHFDKSGAHVERVYLDEARGREDLKLLTEGEGRYAGEWRLDEVPLAGAPKTFTRPFSRSDFSFCQLTPAPGFRFRVDEGGILRHEKVPEDVS